jgi:hypothetical protein
MAATTAFFPAPVTVANGILAPPKNTYRAASPRPPKGTHPGPRRSRRGARFGNTRINSDAWQTPVTT